MVHYDQQAQMAHDSGYIPALSIPQLTHYYNASLATIFQEWRPRMRLVDALQVQPLAQSVTVP